MSCYPRTAAVTNASEAAPISYFHPVGYGETADAGLYPRVLFFVCYLQGASIGKTGDRITLELLLPKYGLKHCEPHRGAFDAVGVAPRNAMIPYPDFPASSAPHTEESLLL